MAANGITLWGIHGGRTGDADSLFLKQHCVALGWHAMGDLGKIAPNREAFKSAVREHYPDDKPGAIPNYTGQLFRFVHEMRAGDIVVYPSKRDREVHLGRVTGSYRYEPNQELTYPHQRPVEWLRALPRVRFTQGALYEIGSAMSFFQIKTYASEFLEAAQGKATPAPPADDETVPQVAENIEETTRDYVLKQLSQEMKGHPFAQFVAQLLGTMGYRTRVSPPGIDGGIDIIAHHDELGFQPPLVKVQVKSIGGNSGDPEVSALYGKLAPGEYALFVTLGQFTSRARQFATGKTNLRLIDGVELVDLVLEHYEQFDARYKAILPLKRVYVPDPEDVEQ